MTACDLNSAHSHLFEQATFASKIEVADKALNVEREVDGGLETITTSIPAVITSDLRYGTW
jgi:electron transfer flavoprotein beta subunit